ncbi:MAG: DNA cytosine methyltransferase [Pseudanabaena sp. ELA607]|jgi:DNA (cytosine-5)-methyltransferase 1
MSYNSISNCEISNHEISDNARPVVLDLFAGAGGMSLGFEAAGFEIGASIEIDPIHCAIHEFNFPYTATICSNIGDVTLDQIEKKLLEKRFNHIDVIVGGPPCQGFSQMGLRQLDDPRNSLVFEYLRLVRHIKPKYFVLENVKGMILGKHRNFVTELIAAFESMGYRIVNPYQVLNAADYGVAQNRLRFILIGIRADQADIAYPPPSHTSTVQDQSILSLAQHIGSRAAIANLEQCPVFIEDDAGLPIGDLEYEGYAEKFNYLPAADFALCHIRNRGHQVIYGHKSPKHNINSQSRFAATLPGEIEPISRFFKLHPDRPCHTLRAGTDTKRGSHTAPRPIHYAQPRCISIREGARLHSFPDWFQFHLTSWHGFRQIGNAVAPLFAKQIGLEIMKGLGMSPSQRSQRVLAQSDENLLRINMKDACKYFNVAEDIIGKRQRKKKAL